MRKVRGVPEADARRAPTASSLSLLGLLKHCTVWEQRWVHGVVAGDVLSDGWPDSGSDGEDDLVVDGTDTVEHWLDGYEQAIRRSREIAAAVGLDEPVARVDVVDCNVRWVLLHLIEETARHAGHADIIRETLDGQRGL